MCDPPTKTTQNDAINNVSNTQSPHSENLKPQTQYENPKQKSIKQRNTNKQK